MKETHQTRAALRKLGPVPDGFEFFRWEAIGNAGDTLLRGGVPRIVTKGPRKGRKTWDTCEVFSVVVTTAEMHQEEAAFVAETGNCPRCFGEGQVVKSWSTSEGVKHTACPTCSGTGKAKEPV